MQSGQFLTRGILFLGGSFHEGDLESERDWDSGWG